MESERLLAFGNSSATTGAEHVSVEFVHPVIVGKRALPVLELGPDFEAVLPVVLQPEDVERTLPVAREKDALTFALTGYAGGCSFTPPDDPFVIQEVFEVLYHV